MSKIPATHPQQEQDAPPPMPEEQARDFASVTSTKANQEPAARPTPENNEAEKAAPADNGQTSEEQMWEARQQLREAQQQMEAAQRKLQEAHDRMEACVSAQNPNHLLSRPEEEEEVQPEPVEEETTQEAELPQEEGHYGILNGFFNGFAKIAPVAFLIMLACMAWPMFIDPAKGVYCPAEVKYLSAFIHSIATNSWLAPTGLENGGFSLPLWPVFSWAIGLFAFIPGLVDTGLLLPLTTFCCTFLAAFGVWALALAAGFGSRAAFASGLIILCAPIFAPLPHFMGPAALASGLLLLALSCFCRGWRADSAFIALPLAFIFTALAGLCGGLLYFATPIVASLLFLVWQGKLRRAQRLDALFGFVLMLVILGVWLGVLMVDSTSSDYLSRLLHSQVQYAMPIPLKWLLPIIAGLVGLLPWLLAILGVSWFRVLGHSAKSLGASRHDNGSALVWISLVFALCISPFVAGFHLSAIAIACLGAVLLGKAFIHLSCAGNRFFFLLASLVLLLMGALFNAVTYSEGQQLIFNNLPINLPVADLPALLLNLQGLQIMGYICIAGGLLGLLFVRRYRAAGGLIFGALVVIALCQPARLLLVPELTAHAGTPLVNYQTVEKQVMAALAPKPVENKAPETAPAPAETQVPAEEAQQPATMEPAEPNAPAETAPAEQPAQQPEQAAPGDAAIAPEPNQENAASPEAGKTEEIIVIEEKSTPQP